jgi:two-component system, sporulation sensor kinase E
MADDEDMARLQKLAALGQMGAGITHEVRNVMTGILGFAQVARQRLDEDAKAAPAGGRADGAAADSKEPRELVAMIEQEARRCLEILSAFLEMSRPAGALRERVDLPSLARDVARLTAHQLSLHGARLELAIDEAAPPVMGRQGALKQVLLNLTLNAMQAMEPRGGEVRIAVRGEGDQAVVEVSDEGPGIAEQARARLFEAFATTKAAGKGTGLGLFVSRRIVEDHGGTIAAESEEGRGARFVIRLPAAR